MAASAAWSAALAVRSRVAVISSKRPAVIPPSFSTISSSARILPSAVPVRTSTPLTRSASTWSASVLTRATSVMLASRVWSSASSSALRPDTRSARADWASLLTVIRCSAAASRSPCSVTVDWAAFCWICPMAASRELLTSVRRCCSLVNSDLVTVWVSLALMPSSTCSASVSRSPWASTTA
ncbi:hypothetical protein D3C72_1455320 [compost metagenome]